MQGPLARAWEGRTLRRIAVKWGDLGQTFLLNIYTIVHLLYAYSSQTWPPVAAPSSRRELDHEIHNEILLNLQAQKNSPISPQIKKS